MASNQGEIVCLVLFLIVKCYNPEISQWKPLLLHEYPENEQCFQIIVDLKFLKKKKKMPRDFYIAYINGKKIVSGIFIKLFSVSWIL